MAAYVEIEIDQYEDYSTTINVEDDQGDYINLYNYSVSSKIKKSPYSTNSYSFNSEIGDYANGEVKLSMTSAISANIRPGRYLYDTIIKTGNTYIRVVEGIVTIQPGITELW